MNNAFVSVYNNAVTAIKPDEPHFWQKVAEFCYEAGKTVGHASGFEDGYEDGRAKGFDVGYECGYDNGFDVGKILT